MIFHLIFSKHHHSVTHKYEIGGFKIQTHPCLGTDMCSQLSCFNRIIQFLLLQADVSRKRKWINFSNLILQVWTLMYYVDRLAVMVQLCRLATCLASISTEVFPQPLLENVHKTSIVHLALTFSAGPK